MMPTLAVSVAESSEGVGEGWSIAPDPPVSEEFEPSLVPAVLQAASDPASAANAQVGIGSSDLLAGELLLLRFEFGDPGLKAGDRRLRRPTLPGGPHEAAAVVVSVPSSRPRGVISG